MDLNSASAEELDRIGGLGHERMQDSACTRMLGCYLVSGAGHWVQQEQPVQVAELLVEFLQSADRA